MYDFLYKLNDLVAQINSCISDYILVFTLAGAGVFYTFRTRFVQVRFFFDGCRAVFGGVFDKSTQNSGGITPFQALATALAAQLGTGNIVGACSAVILGGPGAVFWMWIMAFFSMALSYAEGALAVKTRKINADGSFFGGPVNYIRLAFKGRAGAVLCGFFAFSAILTLGFTGSMVQSNAVSEAFEAAFGMSRFVTGALLVIAVGTVILGGAKGIAGFAEKTVPVMALLFITGCVIILIMYREYVPECFSLVFKSAFSPRSALGGTFGVTLKNALFYGTKRGLFSNEAGMGTAPHAHAMAENVSPHRQGICAMLGVFIDTMVMMTLTAFSVITVVYCADGAGNTLSSTNMTQYAFSRAFGEAMGEGFVALSLFFFAFTSILGWSLFGRMNFHYLFGKRADNAYTAFVMVFVFLGCISGNELVWNLTDLFNQLMVIPNILSLFVLSGSVVRIMEMEK